MSNSRFILPALFIALSASAFAQDNPRAERLQALDLNNDGAISLEESNANRIEMFTSIDINNDGAVTLEEMELAAERRRAERRAERFASADSDGNGTIDQAEFLASQPGNRLFDQLDANDDDLISADELANARQGRRGPRDGRRGRRGRRGSGN